ncbi:ribonuclease H-like domain-containing protein [Tanacetum coccineum]|uniref:Ribonuclease H-like domain-containing protein n=1 Tax=Tanacetum coccineum TaxID=301880 RepID=A0ABQ5HCL1_9ASTR
MSAHDDFSLHDDEELSLHDDASLAGSQPASNKGDAPAKPPQIITTNTLSNIKLPVLQKDDYDTWAMEMEHYLEYIDNEVWKVIQNGNSKKRVTKGKDGVYRVLPPTTQEEQFADEKERKARTGCLEDRVMIGFQNYFTVGCPWCSVSDDDANQKFLRKSKEIIFFTGIGESKQTATPGLADEVIHSFLATNADDVDLIHDDLDQIDDLDLEEMDINWQIAMTAIKIKKFYKEGHGRKPRCGWKMHVAFDKRKVECFNCHNTGHFARECKFKGSKEGGRQEAGKGQNYKPVQIEKEALMTIDEGQINWVEQTEDEELNHALMAFTVNNEMKAENLLFVDDSTVLSLVLASLKSNADVLGYEEEMCSGIFVLRETDEGYYDIHLQQFNRIGSENGKGELGARYSFVRKTCFVYGSLSHLIRIIHERIWRIEVFLIVGCCWAHHDSVTGHLADYKNSPKWDLLLLEEVKEVSVVKICDKKLNVLFTEKECFVVSSDFIDGLHGKSEKQLILLAIPSTGLRWNALALKHLGPVPTTVPTSTNPINTDSSNLNTAFEEVNTGNTEAISPSANHEEERQGTDLTRKKLALQLLYVLDSYKENEEAEQFIWMLLLAQKGDAEEEELVLAKREAMLSRVSKSMLGSELQGKDFAKEMVDLILVKCFKKRLQRGLKEDKDDEGKDDETTKRFKDEGKQIARKSLHQVWNEEMFDDSDRLNEQEETKHRDDLIELYRIVMNRYGLDGPEDKLEKGFWKCLRIMFEEP